MPPRLKCMVRELESNYKGVRVGARSQWLLYVEPESMTGVMGWSQRLGLQSQELWAGATEDMVLEPEAMTGVMGWSLRLWCKSRSL